MAKLTKAEYATLAVSVAALLVSAFTYVDTHTATELQAQELRNSEQRWRDEGPKFTLGNEVAIVTSQPAGVNTKWEYVPAGTNVATNKITPPSSLYVNVTAINNGRFVGGISEVGYYKSEKERVPLESASCLPFPTPSPNNGIGTPCDLPYKLEIAEGVRFYIKLTSLLEADFQCNEYMEQGMKFYVKGLNGDVVDTDTRVAVSNSSYCPTLGPPSG